jgi:Inner membrane protein YgaP-like, transmembrane domain
MKKNVGKTDQIIRIVAGIVLLAVGILVPMSTTLSIILVILGALLLVTGFLGVCPLYALLKINTLKK